MEARDEDRGFLSRWLDETERNAFSRRSSRMALAIFAIEVLAYAGFVTLAIAPLAWFVNVLGGVLAGLAIGVIFTVGHDACHQSLTPSRALNRWIARLSFIPSLHAASLWVLGHNQIHHGRTNLRGHDYVWEPMSPEDYRASAGWRRMQYRIYRSRWGSLPYYLIEMWWKKNFLPIAPEARSHWRRHVVDSGFVVLAGGLHLGAILFVASSWAPDRSLWWPLLAGCLVPFLVWNWLMGLIIYSHHTHPEVPWFADDREWSYFGSQVLGTVHVRLPPPFHWVDNNIMEHTAHHAWPVIPLYHLPTAQQRIRAAFPAVKSLTLWPRVFFGIADACKLFDYRARRWTDFAGRPSGPALSLTTPPAPIEQLASGS